MEAGGRTVWFWHTSAISTTRVARPTATTFSWSLSALARPLCGEAAASVRVTVDLTDCPTKFFAHFVAEPSCDDVFEGGGWALVRRVEQGSNWHPATDNLRGTDSYGTFPLDPLATFSIPYAQYVQPTTEILFRSGLASIAVQFRLASKTGVLSFSFCRRSESVPHHHAW